jgi:hypothetical protein
VKLNFYKIYILGGKKRDPFNNIARNERPEFFEAPADIENDRIIPNYDKRAGNDPESIQFLFQDYMQVG